MKVRFVFILGLVATAIAAAPQAELWPRWEEHDPTSSVAVDHGEWQRFLDRYLVTNHPSGVNRVPYGDIDSSGRALLDRYIATLRSQNPDELQKSEQLPYWINMYNALTVRLILDNWPLDSIRDIDDPWDAPVIEIEGIELTLNDIEHRIIRPIWQDERIHFLVNCASIGCPNLHPRALTSENYERVADQAEREYLAHPRGLDFRRGRLYLSSIFDWYGEDFGADRDDMISYLAQHVPGTLGDRVRSYDGRIRYEYDWSLNGTD
jgi:hypothetical protein